MSNQDKPLNSSGQNWPITSDSAEALIMALEPLKPDAFDHAEIKTLKALVEEHKRFREALEVYANHFNWGDNETHFGDVEPLIVWCRDPDEKGYEVAEKALAER